MPRHPGLKPSTLAVHAGRRSGGGHRSPVTPIFRTSAFAFDGLEQMEETFSGRQEGYIYSRYGNPTVEAAEELLAALEGAGEAVAFGSGMAAIMAALLSVAGSGDHVVAQEDLYGGTSRLLESVMRRLGLRVTFVPTGKMAELERFLRPETRAVHVETPTNPTLKVLDLAELSRRTQAAGVPLLVDNTFATPVNQRPLELGATLVIHSATKSLAGHGDLMAGMVAGAPEAVRPVREIRKETGAVLDPGAGWLLERSLKTLALRVEAQSRNALGLSRRLAKSPGVSVVHYPGLESHPGHAVASRQMSSFGGMLSFELEGGAPAAGRFAGALDMIRLLPTLGGVETSVLVPAVSSHSMIPPETRARAGITDGLIRLSAGIEDLADLIDEIDRALEASV